MKVSQHPSDIRNGSQIAARRNTAALIKWTQLRPGMRFAHYDLEVRVFKSIRLDIAPHERGEPCLYEIDTDKGILLVDPSDACTLYEWWNWTWELTHSPNWSGGAHNICTVSV